MSGNINVNDTIMELEEEKTSSVNENYGVQNTTGTNQLFR